MTNQKCSSCAQKHGSDEEVAPGYGSRRCLSEDPEAVSVIERIKNARAQATLVQGLMLLIVLEFLSAAFMGGRSGVQSTRPRNLTVASPWRALG